MALSCSSTDTHGVKALVVALCVLVFDQITKIGYQDELHTSVALSNEAGGHQSLIQVFVGLALVAICLLIFRKPWWAVGLMAGGFISNLADRIFLGGVRNPVAYGPLWWNWADLFGTIGLAVCIGYFVVDKIALLRVGGGDTG